MMAQFGPVLRGSLLIAGTSIGGGMLALPVLTGQAGFFPSLCIYLACWLFMASTGLLLLEVSLWMEREANIVTMASSTLGRAGKACAWGLYLFLFYCLTLAYIVGAGDLVIDLASGFIELSSWQAELLFLAIFGPIVYVGAGLVSRLTLFLMLGLGLSFALFVYFGASFVEADKLTRVNWPKLWLALPITFTAFAYQGIIPTLVSHMDRNVSQLRLSILIGSFLPFIAYVVWQWLIIGIVPATGQGSLQEALLNGQNAVHPLKRIINTPSIYLIGQCFAFFAILTSFLGVSLGLLDFLADGFNVRKTPQKKLLLALMIFIPPFLFALVYPHVFLIALDYAGGFGCALLLGLLPILMVWRGRYHLKISHGYRVAGGRFLLTLLALFVVFELYCQFALTLNL